MPKLISYYYTLVKPVLTMPQGFEKTILDEAQEFCEANFPEFDNEVSLSKKENESIQKRLLTDLHRIAQSGDQDALLDAFNKTPEALCLRCYISNIILKACHKKHGIFGQYQNVPRFQLKDLLPYALNDYGPSRKIRKSQDFPHSFLWLKKDLRKDSIPPDIANLVEWEIKYDDKAIQEFLKGHDIPPTDSRYRLLKDVSSVNNFKRIYACFHKLPAMDIKTFSLDYKQEGKSYDDETEDQNETALDESDAEDEELDPKRLEKGNLISIAPISKEETQRHENIFGIFRPLYQAYRREHGLGSKNPCKSPREYEGLLPQIQARLKDQVGLDIPLDSLEKELDLMAKRVYHYEQHKRLVSNNIPDEPRLEVELSKMVISKEELQQYINSAISSQFDQICQESFRRPQTKALLLDVKSILYDLYSGSVSQQHLETKYPTLSQSDVSRYIKPLGDRLYEYVHKKVKDDCRSHMKDFYRKKGKNVEDPAVLSHIEKGVEQAFFEGEEALSPRCAKLGDARTRVQRTGGNLYVECLCTFLTQSQEQ